MYKSQQITMDFITNLSSTAKGFDTSWFMVDRLTKIAHFLTIQEGLLAEKLPDAYVREIVARYSMTVSIVSDRDVQFTSRFWQRFHDELGTRLHFSTAYHPHTYRKSEQTIQMLKDIMRDYVINFSGSQDYYLPLPEFSYNKNYPCSSGSPPYKLLYGRKCCTVFCQGEVNHRVMGRTEAVLQTMQLIHQIKQRLQTAQSQQKSYVDRQQSELEFQVEDMVLLNVFPKKGVIHFRKRGKLVPKFIGPFRVVKRVGKVAYQLDLHEKLSQINNTSLFLGSRSVWLMIRWLFHWMTFLSMSA